MLRNCQAVSPVGRALLAAVVIAGGLSSAPPAVSAVSGDENGAIVLETIPGEARPIVELTINGQGPYRFFVDTGAGGNLVSATLAERLGLESTGRQRIFNPTSGGAQEVDLVTVEAVESGAMRIEHVPFVAADLPQLGDSQGVLSVRSLPQGLVTFDFPAGTIRIEPGVLDAGEPEVMPYQPVPVIGVAGEVDGRALTFHLDTGSPDGITLPGALAADLSFDGELRTTRERGPLVVRTGRLRGTVRIGHLLLENPEVQVVDLFSDFGNIGSLFLRDRVLVIDRESSLLRLTAPVLGND